MPGPSPLRGLLAQHLAIYRSPSVAAPGLGFFFYTVMFVAMLTLVPPLFGTPHQPLLAGLMPLTSIAVSLTLGVWLLRWISPVRLVQLGFACGMGAVMLLWGFWAQGGLPVALALVLAGALGLVQGASFASIPALNSEPAARVRAAGAVAQLGNLGTTTGTPILAMLIAGWGIDGLLGFAVPFCIGGLGVTQWLWLRRRGV
jgi:MFS transporter, DHA1 family, inner membrane transport protein